jgi:cytochrome c-type biogenesis protein CcmH
VRALIAVVLLALAGLAFGQSAEVANPDPKVEERLKALALELRCLVCQNQTIADSNAPLAVDLRQQIRAQIAQGRSDDQIRDYMVERYGDFVLYKPPFKATTAVLWAAPFVLLALGAGVLFGVVRRRRSAPSGPAEVAPSRRAEIEALLAGEAPTPGAASRPAASAADPAPKGKKRRPRR